MHGNSKSERVDIFIRRAVRRALQQLAIERKDTTEFIREHISGIAIRVADEATQSPYIMKELQDIMDWKKGPRV